ncbi:MAG: ABC transporter permease [Clostridia bacterium]|nr:ABC transporter permease [Clostridia bacterium]
MSAIFKREFKSYFTSPLGYVYLAIFLFFEGYFFVNLFGYGSPNNEIIFPSLSIVVVLVTPVLTMRLLSEERRQKIDQALLTAPVSVTGIVLGKFFACLAVYALAFSPVVLFEIIVTLLSSPNWLIFLNAWLGAMLVGAALIAIGMFISALTESPIISCILTLITFLLLMVLPSLAALSEVQWVIDAANKMAFVNLVSSFTSSIFSVVDVIFLVSIVAVFVFLSIRAVERRRWA